MRSAVAPLLVAAAAALGACGGGHASPAKGGPGAGGTPAPPPARIAILGARGRPDRGITVRARHGKLTDVTVRRGGDTVPGTLNDARTVWHTKWALGVSKRYRVTATATPPSGDAVTKRRAFTTLTPEDTFAPRTIMVDGGTYGVGMPLIFYFDDPDVDRRAVERSLELRTSRKVVGSWYWSETCGIVPLCLYFRPRHHWHPNTKVHWTAHEDGVQFKPGVFGTQDMSGTINIGRSLRVVASTAKHYMDVYKHGKKYAHWPISTGRPGDDTPNGAYLAIEKHNPELMVGDDYRLSVPYSVRISWSGVYLHAASWSVGSQGSVNVSHGCVNMSPANAAEYYEMSLPGDPVTIKGSSRAGVFDDGWTMWFKSWKEWRAGSALHQAVRAGKRGSEFLRA